MSSRCLRLCLPAAQVSLSAPRDLLRTLDHPGDVVVWIAERARPHGKREHRVFERDNLRIALSRRLPCGDHRLERRIAAQYFGHKLFRIKFPLGRQEVVGINGAEPRLRLLEIRGRPHDGLSRLNRDILRLDDR